MFSLFKKKEVDNNLYAPVDGRIIPLEEVPDEVFAKKERALAGVTAPAKGLTLVRVLYD